MSYQDDAVLRAIERRREAKKNPRTKSPPTPNLETKATPMETMLNPITNRPMKIGGRTHKAYLKSLHEKPEVSPLSLGTMEQSAPEEKPSKKRKHAASAAADDELAAVEMTEEELEKLITFAQTFLPAKTVDLLFNN